MFTWLDKIGITENISKLRVQINIKSLLQNWIIYNSPALIWSFSFTVLLGIIWDYKLNKESLLFLLIPSFLGILSEIFQKINLINGTFDYIDLYFYLLGGLSGCLVIKLLNTKHELELL